MSFISKISGSKPLHSFRILGNKNKVVNVIGCTEGEPIFVKVMPKSSNGKGKVNVCLGKTYTDFPMVINDPNRVYGSLDVYNRYKSLVKLLKKYNQKAKFNGNA